MKSTKAIIQVLEVTAQPYSQGTKLLSGERQCLLDAAKIVGVHEELVAAATKAHAEMRYLMKAYEIVQKHYGRKPEESPIYAAALEAQKQLTSALGKAEQIIGDVQVDEVNTKERA